MYILDNTNGHNDQVGCQDGLEGRHEGSDGHQAANDGHQNSHRP